MRKAFLTFLFALAMGVMLLPATSLAAAPTQVIVGDENVTTGFTTPQSLYGGYVTYSGGRLTLEHVSVNISHPISGNPDCTAAISADGDLTIEFSGSNTVSAMASDMESYGIYVGGGTLAFTGTPSATLAVTSADLDPTVRSALSYGIYASAMDNDAAILFDAQGTIHASAGTAAQSYGIYGTNNGGGAGVEIRDGTIRATSGTGSVTSSNSYGIYGANSGTGNGVVIDGGMIMAQSGAGGSEVSCGVYGAANADDPTKSAVLISGGNLTTIAGAAVKQSYGLYGAGSAKGVQITGGTITQAKGGNVTGDNTAKCVSAGIIGVANGGQSDGGVLISGSAEVKDACGGNVTGGASYGASCGIFGQSARSGASVKICDLASVTASSQSTGTSVDYSCGIYGYTRDTATDVIPVEISGGTVTATGGDGENSFGVFGRNAFAESTKATVALSGGTLTAIGGGASSQSIGIRALNRGLGDGVAISGGTITARGGGSDPIDSAGVYADNASLINQKHAIVISGGSLSAYGDTALTGSYGIRGTNSGTGDTVLISGGTVTAISGIGGMFGYGVDSDRSISLTGGITTFIGEERAVSLQPDFGAPANLWYMWKENTAKTPPSGDYTISSTTEQFSNYSNARYLKVRGIPALNIGDVTVAGVIGTAITEKDVTLSLTNDYFTGIALSANASGWFTNLPAGLSAKIKAEVIAGATTATITIYGTPSAASTAAMTAAIPAATLAGGDDMTATVNPSAKYAIMQGTVATPAFNPAAGTYTSAQRVAISCATAGATIRYTTDGSDPTVASATYATGTPIAVSATTTLKAKAFMTGLADSAVATALYTINIPPVYVPVTVSPASSFSQGNAPELEITIGAGMSGFNATNNYDGLDSTSQLTPSLGTVGAPGSDGKVTDGSIKLTLNRSYLNTLAPGTYALRVKLKGGGGLPAYAEARFTVTAPVAPVVPQTGDRSTPLLWLGFIMITGAALCICAIRRRKSGASAQ